MKYIFLLCLSLPFCIPASEHRQTYQDLLNHFASAGNFREIIRHFNCFIEESNTEKVQEIIQFLESQTNVTDEIRSKIKTAWHHNETRDNVLKKADAIREQRVQECEQVPISNARGRYDAYIPVTKALEVQAQLKEFDAYMSK